MGTCNVSHKKIYIQKLKSDKFVITKTCCEDLRTVDPIWQFCPFCGSEIVITDLEQIIEEE